MPAKITGVKGEESLCLYQGQERQLSQALAQIASHSGDMRRALEACSGALSQHRLQCTQASLTANEESDETGDSPLPTPCMHSAGIHPKYPSGFAVYLMAHLIKRLPCAYHQTSLLQATDTPATHRGCVSRQLCVGLEFCNTGLINQEVRKAKRINDNLQASMTACTST